MNVAVTQPTSSPPVPCKPHQSRHPCQASQPKPTLSCHKHDPLPKVQQLLLPFPLFDINKQKSCMLEKLPLAARTANSSFSKCSEYVPRSRCRVATVALLSLSVGSSSNHEPLLHHVILLCEQVIQLRVQVGCWAGPAALIYSFKKSPCLYLDGSRAGQALAGHVVHGHVHQGSAGGVPAQQPVAAVRRQ